MIPRLKITYEKEIASNLMSKLSLKNRHEVPKIKKIILNMGLGEDASDGKKLKSLFRRYGSDIWTKTSDNKI